MAERKDLPGTTDLPGATVAGTAGEKMATEKWEAGSGRGASAEGAADAVGRAAHKATDATADTARRASERVGQSARRVGEAAAEAIDSGSSREAFGKARGAAGQIMEEMRDAAQSIIEDQKARAAEAVHGIAEVLHRTAESIGRDNPQVGRITGRAAERIDDLSQTVRDRRWGDLVGDLEAFALRQPAVFLIGALTMGFVVGRFMAASGRPGPGRYGDGESYEPTRYSYEAGSGTAGVATEMRDRPGASGSSGVM